VVVKVNYYEETDSLYTDLSTGLSVDNREMSDGVVLDYDAEVKDLEIINRHSDLNEEARDVLEYQVAW
jgi:uncharacterized protein YuzE